MPEVSVVMSVYNGEEALPDTLDSLMRQTECDFEVVAINDGSTDRSGLILDAWAAEDPRLHVIHQPNQGLTRALVRGCDEAQGEFIARQDVGDASLAGRLKEQAAVLRSNPSVAFVSCNYRLVGPCDEPLADVETQPASSVETGLKNSDGTHVRSPHHGSVMFRKSAYVAAGGYRPEFYFAQDVDLWSRLIDQGDLAYVPQFLYQVKFDLNGITAHHRADQERLRTLVAKARLLRMQGQSDGGVVAQAAAIRPGSRNHAGRSKRDPHSAANYFVGSCLARRGDRRAISYLSQVVRENPLHLQAWFKLAMVFLNPQRQAS